MPKLKVFRTAIGFHDAYVAAPTKKAALVAWGASKNLFQRGDAEEVTDPTLTKAPLALPGEVIKVVRGTEAEHLAALPKDAPKPKKATAEKPAKPKRGKPRPSRAALDKAEDALDAARTDYEQRLADLARREAELQRARRDLDAERRSALAKLEAARDKAFDTYETALATWRDEEG